MDKSKASISTRRHDQYYSADLFSPGYDQLVDRLEDYTWYDVHPYSLMIWPHLYSDKRRVGRWKIQRNNYHSAAIELQLEGSTIYRIGREDVHLNPDELFLTLPGSTLSLRNGSEVGRQLLVVISGGMVGLMFQTLGVGTSCRIKFAGDVMQSKPIHRCISRIGELLRLRQAELAQENSFLGYQLGCLLGNCVSQMYLQDLPEPLTRAVRMMGNGYGTQYPIGELAMKLGISRMGLNALFQRYLGTTPRAYREKMCMENAVQMVGGSPLSFKEIAARLGFRNGLYFSSVFHRYTGLSPTAYRQKAQNK